MAAPYRRIIVIILGIFVIVASAFLIHATLNAKKFQKNFGDEMALRLDLEEKLVGMELERSRLSDALKSVQAALQETRQEIEALRQTLVLEQEEKNALKKSLSETLEANQSNVSAAPAL